MERCLIFNFVLRVGREVGTVLRLGVWTIVASDKERTNKPCNGHNNAAGTFQPTPHSPPALLRVTATAPSQLPSHTSSAGDAGADSLRTTNVVSRTAFYSNRSVFRL